MHAKVPEFATIYSRPHSEKISPPMRSLLQRVLEAKVMVDGEITGEIQHGILVFLGLGKDDNLDKGKKLIDKILK